MTANKMQYFFADYPPQRLFHGATVLAGAFLGGLICHPNRHVLSDLGFWVNFSVVVLLGGAAGYLIAPIIGFIIYPLCWLLEKLNGAPFNVGDTVVILSKPHRGRAVRIYEIWKERHEVRVELGDEAKESASDVFAYTSVCRVSRHGSLA